MLPTKGYALLEKGGRLTPWNFERREARPDDVVINIRYAGVCHSDVHAVRGSWAQEIPLVPGHEIMGEVLRVGANVTNFKAGDPVLVGTIVDSCRTCQPCQDHNEVYCRAFPTTTYDSIDRVDGTRTRGGFSTTYVADKRFVYHLPQGMDPAGAAPLLCAGITTFSPLRHLGVGPGKAVGVIGIGGLGHLAVKLARAMGAHVVAFTTSAKKAAEAHRLGAHEVVLSKDADAMKAQVGRLDFILDTVSARHNLDPYLLTLKLGGTLCSLGLPDSMQFTPMLLAISRISITSSGTGGTHDTLDMLEFCAKHNIVSDIELIKMGAINEAFDRLEAGDVKYRFVIDMAQSGM